MTQFIRGWQDVIWALLSHAGGLSLVRPGVIFLLLIWDPHLQCLLPHP